MIVFSQKLWLGDCYATLYLIESESMSWDIMCPGNHDRIFDSLGAQTQNLMIFCTVTKPSEI